MDEAGGDHDGRRGEHGPFKISQTTADSETCAQRALANQPWKEYTAEGGRKYWYNTETKQSSWEMPEAYKNALGARTPTIPTG